MTEAQKIIKYFALAFAIFLIVGIVAGIVGSLSFVTLMVTDNEPSTVETYKEYSIGEVSKLDIDIPASEFEIRVGESFTLTSNHDDLKINESSDTLKVIDTKRKFKFNETPHKVILTVPYDHEFEDVKIKTGAARMKIALLCTQELDFELGAGEVILEGVTVYEDTKLKGGAGALDISNCTFNDLDMKIGVGESNITAAILGESKIECSVGECNLNLIKDLKTDYTLKIEKGIGAVEVDDKYVEDGAVVGTGDNEIDIKCGVGAVEIDFVTNNTI